MGAIWVARPDRVLRRSVAHETLATTNMWHARLCKSAARAGIGALGARVLASSRDNSPGIRRCCARLRIAYATIPR